ncbi:MAG: M20/M25/M40 family metallo-hydrolase [Oscillospiraceae bacterium]|jgi:endoglucanase|nr:M20/M25/M40 family metallo-hydrolase [Oscillospiraceae bacterium]
MVKKKLLIDAHLDEVGIVVTENVEGFLKIAAVGNPDTRTFPCGEWEFSRPNGEKVYGVTAFLPPHLTGGEKGSIVPIDELFIDTGGVELPVGTFGTRRMPEFDSGKFIAAKALDNRSSCAVLLDVLKRLGDDELPIELAALFSSQEEVGLRGAGTAAERIRPDYAVIVDVTFGQAADTKGYDSFPLGKGPTIAVGPSVNRAFTDKLKRVASRHGIPCAAEVLPGGSGTNADRIQTAGYGVATAIVSIPLRYMHTGVETLDIRDVQAAGDLIYYLIKEWDYD